jgi:hypothetical protein
MICWRLGGRFTARSLHAAATSQETHHTNHTLRIALSALSIWPIIA